MALLASGKPAPRFHLASVDGRDRDVPAEPGLGSTLVAFFKVGCPTCQLTFPFLERYHQRFEAPELRVLGVSQDDEAASRSFAERHGVNFPILLDAKGYAASRAYGVVTVPSLLLVGPDGTVGSTIEGFVKAKLDALAQELGSLLGKSGDPVWLPGETVPALKPG